MVDSTFLTTAKGIGSTTQAVSIFQRVEE